MSQPSGPSPHAHHEHASVDNLKIAFLLNLVFTVLEFVGGSLTNSISIMTDALHDGGDCFSLGLAWYLQRLSRKSPNAAFTYGYRRFSNLGALISGAVLTVGLGFVGWNAALRLRDPEEVMAPGMAALAVVGILFNGAAAWWLHGGQSLNEKLASWHLLEDTLGWIAVLIGALAMLVWDVPILDPLLAILISVFVLTNVFRNLRQVALVFLQSTPAGFDAQAFDRQVGALPGVVDSHHTHTWTLDGEHHVFSTHLVMNAETPREQIVAVKKRVHEILHTQHFMHVTIEIELEGEACAAEEGYCG